MSDPVKAPAHYEGDGVTTCKVALRSMMHKSPLLDNAACYWWGCAFKYLWRWPFKDGLKDLKKCRECLDELIAHHEECALCED